MNKKFIKTGILIVMLVVPVFIFLFLNIFGNNRFDLPYYFPELDASGKVVINAESDTVFMTAPDFNLVDQNGNSFNSEVLQGMPYVVNFFFTRCGAICPTMNKNIARVYDNVDVSKVKFISISIDPDYDSVQVLKEYAEQFDGTSASWSFLTGSKDYIYDLAIKGFKLPVSDASNYDENLSIDETFIHSEKFLLIDSEGYFRGIYDGTDDFEVERLMVEIDILNSSKTK